jgi:oligopeptide/dipeptide ABC transporter ATP-binding protein
LLEIHDLRVEVAHPAGPVEVLSGVDLQLSPGQTLGLVGESGSGKSMTALAVLGLLPRGARMRTGTILLEGEDLRWASASRMRAIRGDRIGMVFQEPMTSLDPVFTVGAQCVEVVRRHKRISRDAAKKHAIEMFARVGIPDPGRRFESYPHELSGGLRQRVLLAMALSCEPDVLIADEPTTALDATVQRQVLDLIAELKEATGIAVLFVTHDLGVIAEIADDVAVMYAGQIVESGPVRSVLRSPSHPYTAALLDCRPRPSLRRLAAIPGSVPAPVAYPGGCRFHPRCPHVLPGPCTTATIEMRSVGSTQARCCRVEELVISGSLRR